MVRHAKKMKKNKTLGNTTHLMFKSCLLCTIAIVAVTIVLAGCKQEKNREIIQPESETVETQGLSEDKEYVIDAFSVEKTYHGYEYDILTDEVSTQPVDAIAKYRIPKIDLESEDVEQINQEIYEAVYPLIQQSIDQIDSTGDVPGVIMDADYFWFANGDILSLVVKTGPIGYSDASPDFLIYNLSVDDMKQLSHEEVYTAAGFTKDEFYKTAKEALGSKYWEGYDRNSEFVLSMKDEFNTYLEKTISDENINASYLYLNDKGQLCLVGKRYSFVQMSGRWVQLNLDDYNLVQDYDVPLGDQLTTSAGSFADIVSQIQGEWAGPAAGSNITIAGETLTEYISRTGGSDSATAKTWNYILEEFNDESRTGYKIILDGAEYTDALGDRQKTEYWYYPEKPDELIRHGFVNDQDMYQIPITRIKT